jgi:hypothetical protein
MAGSNTSTVTLRIVGGDEKGSLKSQRVKYGQESQGTRTRERLCWRGPAAYTKERLVLPSERAPHKNKTVTVKDYYKYPVMSLGFNTKTHWLTDRQSQCDCDFEYSPVRDASRVGSCRIMARRGLGCEKKTSCVMRSETAINPLPGYG